MAMCDVALSRKKKITPYRTITQPKDHYKQEANGLALALFELKI
jgi:hypothetical protein